MINLLIKGSAVCALVGLLFTTACSKPGSDDVSLGDSGLAALDESETHRNEDVEAIPDFMEMNAALTSTRLSLVDGEIVLDTSNLSDEEAAAYQEKLIMAKVARDYLMGADLSQSKKIAVIEGEDVNTVIFDLNLPEGALGGDFSYTVVLDSDSNRVKRILVSD